MHWLAKYLSWFFWLVVEGLHSGYWSFHRGHVSKIEYILETFLYIDMSLGGDDLSRPPSHDS